MSEIEELRKLLEERDRLVRLIEQREREIRALAEQQQKVLNERARMIEELQARNRELSILLSVIKAASQSLDLSEMLHATLEKLTSELELTCGFVHLFEGKRLILKASIGLTPTLQETLSSLEPGEAFIAEVLKSPTPFVVNDLENELAPVLLSLTRIDCSSYLGLSLRSGEEALGVLSLGSHLKQAFGAAEVNLLSGIARELSITIQNARLFQEVKETGEELQFVSQLEHIMASGLDLRQGFDRFIQEMRRYLPVDWAGVTLIEGDQLRLGAVSGGLRALFKEEEILPLKGTATEWVSQHRRALVEGDLEKGHLFWTGERHLQAGARAMAYLPLIFEGECFGALILGSSQPRAFGSRELRLFELLAAAVAPIIKNDLLHSEVQQALEEEKRAKEELSRAADEMVNLAVYIAGVLEPASRRHAERVAGLCSLLGEKLGLPQEEIKKLERAAELHNLGLTFFVPREIVHKRPEARAPEEQEIYKSHITRWCGLLSQIPQLRELVPYIEAHHERYDGSGYPKGLKGDQMRLEAHILIVAHAFDAMTELPSGQGLSRGEALERFRKEAGIKWHPKVVQALCEIPLDALTS